MSCYRFVRSRRRGPTEINMAPLIDMVFLLLIFFLVTASFVRESGVDVNRPVAATATEVRNASLIVGVTADGMVHVDRTVLDIRSVRPAVERFLAETPAGAVVVAADEAVTTGRLVRVLDQCRLAGASNLSVAARVLQGAAQ